LGGSSWRANLGFKNRERVIYPPSLFFTDIFI